MIFCWHVSGRDERERATQCAVVLYKTSALLRAGPGLYWALSRIRFWAPGWTHHPPQHSNYTCWMLVSAVNKLNPLTRSAASRLNHWLKIRRKSHLISLNRPGTVTTPWDVCESPSPPPPPPCDPDVVHTQKAKVWNEPNQNHLAQRTPSSFFLLFFSQITRYPSSVSSLLWFPFQICLISRLRRPPRVLSLFHHNIQSSVALCVISAASQLACVCVRERHLIISQSYGSVPLIRLEARGKRSKLLFFWTRSFFFSISTTMDQSRRWRFHTLSQKS